MGSTAAISSHSYTPTSLVVIRGGTADRCTADFGQYHHFFSRGLTRCRGSSCFTGTDNVNQNRCPNAWLSKFRRDYLAHCFFIFGYGVGLLLPDIPRFFDMARLTGVLTCMGFANGYGVRPQASQHLFPFPNVHQQIHWPVHLVNYHLFHMFDCVLRGVAAI